MCVCSLCACAYWEYMLSFTADGTRNVELHQFHLAQPIRAGTVYFPLAGIRLESTSENPWLIHL